MKALITISTLVVAASPLSALILNTPFNALTTDILTGSSVFLSAGSVLNTWATGIGKRPSSLVSVSSESASFFTAFTFQPQASGNYSFSTQYGDNTLDGFMAIYQGSYNPASPLTNLLAFNNDAVPVNQQSIPVLSLTSGVNYVLVNTIANGNLFGSNSALFSSVYNNRSVNTVIGGPGPLFVNDVPFGVDSTLGLAVLGAVGALRLRRRRNA